jgi:hypothetical protein
VLLGTLDDDDLGGRVKAPPLAIVGQPLADFRANPSVLRR